MNCWSIYATAIYIFANTICIVFGNSDYEYDYSYYGGYDYGVEQESTIPEEADAENVNFTAVE